MQVFIFMLSVPASIKINKIFRDNHLAMPGQGLWDPSWEGKQYQQGGREVSFYTASLKHAYYVFSQVNYVLREGIWLNFNHAIKIQQ